MPHFVWDIVDVVIGFNWWFYSTFPVSSALFLFLTGYSLSYWLFITLHILSPDNTDNADYRRRKAGDHGLNVPEDVIHETGYMASEGGYLLFNQKWLPIVSDETPIETVVILCHGFGDHSAGFQSRMALRFARAGFGVVSLDYFGHGRSDGLHGLINNVDDIVKDVLYFIDQSTIRGKRLDSYRCFIYGESLGGAVSFKVCTSNARVAKKCIKGALLLSPMIKISDKMKPPEFIVRFLKMVRSVLPFAPIAPVPDLVDKCFKVREMARLARLDPIAYHKKPRLQSCVAMMRCTDQIAACMEDLRLPVIILHGEADVVTAPELSQELYNRCSSTDKTLNIYPSSWHNLLAGEPEDISKAIALDIIKWIEAHARRAKGQSFDDDDDDNLTETSTCSSPGKMF